jgi:cobalt-precorrin-5B (C1)-methyltransferase
MIRRAVTQVLDAHGRSGCITAEIFVPRGEELAHHTLNRRLGIEGGISILGTTGIVRPLSHAAYTATIDAALSVARSSGLHQAVFTTGRRSERFAQGLLPKLPAEAFVQIGDYFAHAMAAAADGGFEKVTLAVFLGKAVKMSQRIPHTHARSAALTLAQLAQWVLETGCDPDFADQVAAAHTARHAFDIVKPACPALIDRVGREVVKAALAFSRKALKVDLVIFDFDGAVCFNSTSHGEEFSK